jgi:hypothetical protein
MVHTPFDGATAQPGSIRKTAGRHLLENLELWLSSVGVAVVFIAPIVLLRRESSAAQTVDAGTYWRTAWITAMIIAVLHGIIFWGVRRRQRCVRADLLLQVRMMLSDVVNNDLQVITLGLSQHPELVRERAALAKMEKAVRRITAAVDDVSEESLQSWRDRYPM